MASDPNWSKLGMYMNLVYSFPTTVMAGGGVGWLLDRSFGTAPWFTVIGFFAGLAGGFALLFRTIKLIQKPKSRD